MDPATAGIVAALLGAIAPGTLQAIADRSKEAHDKVKSYFITAFSDHLSQTYEKCKYTNTIFTGENSVPLKDIYTNLYISRSEERWRDDDILRSLNDIGNFIVYGTGGAGKTMLMKYLALQSIEEPVGKIPLFIELRNLPKQRRKSFYQSIFEYCTPVELHKNFNLFKEGLNRGIFLIFFDGLDEVSHESRENIYRSIRRIPMDYPNVKVIASTRPEIDTRNWGELHSYQVDGLNLEQATLIIKKTEFIEELKNDFLKILDGNFFQKHESFLSVPLLCSLMLFTFNEYREVPSRLTVFYEQAFETLFRKHDKMKEGYFNRQFECKLSADRFRSVFAAFCYRTLALNKVSFTDEEIHHHIARASAVTEIDVDADCYCKDLVSAVCVIMRDGLKLHFIHRSFQEYFAALYILRYRGDDTIDVYNRIILGTVANDVAQMALDIDNQTFEREWALPTIKDIKRRIWRSEAKNRVGLLLRKTTYSVRVEKSPPYIFFAWSWTTNERELRQQLTALGRCYSDRFEALIPWRFTGRLKHFGTMSEAVEAGVPLPAVVKHGFRDEPTGLSDESADDDYVEVEVSKGSLAWLEQTTLMDRLQECVDAIASLNQELSERVQAREKIDILR